MANFFVRSAAAGTADGLSWTNAKTTLAAGLALAAAGDMVFVADDHNESSASTITLTGAGTLTAPVYILCADHTVTSPTFSDLKTSAVVTTTGTTAVIFAGNYYVYGLITVNGSGAVNAGALLGNLNNGWQKFDNCKFQTPATGAGTFHQLGSATANRCTYVELNNCSFKFGATAQFINPMGVILVWRNSTAIDATGSIPVNLFSQSGSTSNPFWTMLAEGVDFSGTTNTLFAGFTAGGHATLKDCKINASVTINTTRPQGPMGMNIDLVRCDSGSTGYRTELHRYTGDQTTETTIIRTGGASDGATGISNKIATNSASLWHMPFAAVPFAVKNLTVASNVTVTVEGVWNAAALPNNDDIWFDVEYLGTSASPLGSFASGTKSNMLASGSALTASTQAWDSLVTARANSHAQTVGDVIKVASNPGRIFFCTAQTGNTASSEPGGFATAVDGGIVTDGNVTWRAAVRFKQSVTLSAPQPGLTGYLYIYPKAAKASSTFYLDPDPVLS